MTRKTSPAYRASKEETIPINKLHPFSNHPFHIRHDLEFSELVDSISESGIITPIIVRPKVGVGYEVISGHRRWEACKELGIESIPARVEYIDDDEATILMVNSNIQREHVLPSEKAFAYKMRMEALKHQGRATLGQVVPKLKYNRSEAVIGEEVGESYKQVQRYIEDIQTLVQKINDYRNAAVTEGIYQAFQNDVDPNGNPYGYDSLTGQRSNNLQHGVTWNYANGIYNDTAEIISLAAVYYQQDWPRSELLSAFSDNVPFTKFCRALAAYGLDVTARESAPYSCMSYGGCVNGYRSEGEMVSIKDYRLETHTCSEGDDACGQYDAAAEWHWNEGHAENRSYSIWKEDGTHDVTVFFPIIFPDGATGSALSDLPEEYNAVADGKIKAADCTGNIVLDESANLYKGELNDWFYTPDELTVTFTVVTGEGDDAVSDDYEVAFTNATAIPWCPGELNDGQYGHYDLSCTIYLTGYDRYTDPETQAPNGADGGTGNLEALAESCDAGTLTRTIIKQDQYGNEYAGNAVSARYTKTITLPNGASGFQGWYKDGEDTYGNVEWASLLYRMDWEELYGIVDGIKCRATGSGMTEEELRQLFASLNIDATTARGQVVAFALSCQGKFVYAQPSSLRGGPGSPSVGINLDCSSFVQYCYWAQNLPFSAGSTAAYRNAADLVSISTSEVQPGDLRVVYASGGEQGHVQMALGGDAWIECCYGYGVAVNMSNAWMESRPCYYFRYAGF